MNIKFRRSPTVRLLYCSFRYRYPNEVTYSQQRWFLHGGGITNIPYIWQWLNKVYWDHPKNHLCSWEDLTPEESYEVLRMMARIAQGQLPDGTPVSVHIQIN